MLTMIRQAVNHNWTTYRPGGNVWRPELPALDSMLVLRARLCLRCLSGLISTRTLELSLYGMKKEGRLHGTQFLGVSEIE